MSPIGSLCRYFPKAFPVITGKALGYNGILASPAADLSKKQAPRGAADSETGRMGKRPKNTSVSDV